MFPDKVAYAKDHQSESTSGDLTWYGVYAGWEAIAVPLFDISAEAAQALFIPNRQEKLGLTECFSDASPTQVANMLQEFLDKPEEEEEYDG